jgi:type I restriction-modification system DNA methylase subunit
MSKEEARKKIALLVEKWRKLEAEGKLRSLSENDTKSIFIEPLFDALGWDTKEFDEVSREEAVSRKRVDYAFKLSGVTRFFLEAKAASVPLEEKEAKQATDYAHYKSVPWAVLTNFKELVVYDCERESLSDQRFLNFTIDTYVSDFDRLWLLCKEGIASGELEKFAQGVGRGKKREPLTKKLFADFREWRGLLSRNISEHSRLNKLESKELVDEGVQKLLNRFVFIRSCEDRGFENQRLREAVRSWKSENKRKLLRYLMDVFDDFNEAYDSDLFSPHFASSLYVDDAIVEKVVEELYKYEFGIIDADVLGNVYEQYLATMMREGGGLRDSDSKRKEMGIYYTPTYIVDYIVKNTLGELVSKAKSPADLERIKVLDPACGSGSFLIRAYETLNSAYSKKNGGDSQLLLETVSKNAYTILTKNVYGVDLDQKAVEIAELNLLLRAARRRGMLPPLYENVKCGNSLISGTPEEMEKYFGKEWKKKKPFNWEEKFSDVMKEGGFDVVIGNPPYVQLSMDSGTDQKMKDYLVSTYGSSMGRLNTFGFFIARSIQLAKDGGLIGLIIPNTLLTQEYYGQLRKTILETCQIRAIITFDELPFKDAVVENIIIILKKTSEKKALNSNEIKILTARSDLVFFEKRKIKQTTFGQSNIFSINVDEGLQHFKDKMRWDSVELGSLCEINQAIALKHERSKYLFDSKKGENYKPVIDGRHIGRYRLQWAREYLRYELEAIHSCKREDIFLTKEKIFFRRVGDRLIATLDQKQFYALNTLIVVNAKKDAKLHYILGIFNSKAINFYYQKFLKSTKKVFSEIQAHQVSQIPIHLASESEQKPIIALVDKMLDLNKRLAEMGETKSNERHELEQEIKQTDEKIDELVYKLYGITDEERKTIEASFQ